VFFCCLRAASKACAGTIGYDRSVDAFARANLAFAIPMIEPLDKPAMTTRFLAKASGDQ
jgi:hypothetical protein